MTNRNKGLIYKTLDYKESSKLLFVYTPTGKVTLVANGIKSLKNEHRHLAQYLTLIEFDMKDKDMYSLSKPILLNDYRQVKVSYQQTKHIAIILELIDHLITEDLPHDKVYSLLEYINTNVEMAHLIFAVKLLFLLGYGLDFVGNDPVGFSIKEARVATKTNRLYPEIGLEETVLLSKVYFYKQEDELTLTSDEIMKIETFIRTFYRYHLEYDIKGLRE